MLRKKRFALIILLILIWSGILIPNQLTQAGNQARAWLPEISITRIALDNATNQPSFNLEYKNITHDVQITIQNSGSTVLKDIVIKYEVKRGTQVDKIGFDYSKTKLDIQEIYMSEFQWTPKIGLGTIYTIMVNVTADNFGQTLEPVIASKNFEIKDVKKDIGPIDYSFNTPASEFGYEFTNISQKLMVKVKNFGNFDVSGAFDVEATIYTFVNFTQLWTETVPSSSSIPASDYIEIKFDTYWDPPRPEPYIINISTSLNGDENLFNNNLSLQIDIKNVTDASIIKIYDFVDDGVYPNVPITVSAQLGHLGNKNITTDFSAKLLVNAYPSGTTVFSPSTIQIQATAPQNVSTPGSRMSIIFTPWDYTGGLTEGEFWLNVSINAVEENGSNFNNNRSVLIEVKNITEIELECKSPMPGMHYKEDITNISVRVWNKGTEDLGPYQINFTIKNQDSEELWDEYPGIKNGLGLNWNSWVDEELLSDWLLDYNAKFQLNITLVTQAEPGIILAQCIRTFDISGGTLNGIVMGRVLESGTHEPVENITVSLYTNTTQKILMGSTNTNESGNYSLEVLASPAGLKYLVAVNDEDNYWWFDRTMDVNLSSGRNKTVDLIISRKPTARIDGNVNLLAVQGNPGVDQDWSDCEIEVEDTPLKFAVDNSGNFDFELVVEVVNVTVSKPNFLSDRLEYITLYSGETESVEFSLYELWSVMVTPGNTSVDIDPYTTVFAQFDDELNVSTININTFVILDQDGNKLQNLTFQNSYTPLKNNKGCRIKPPTVLEYNTTYFIKITTGIKTSIGEPAIHRDWISEFKTTKGQGSVMGYCSYYWIKAALEDVNVSIVSNPEFASKTDNDGLFIIENIPSGMYQLIANIPGEPKQTKPLEILPDKVTWLNFSFMDTLPIPIMMAPNEQLRNVIITDNMVDRIIVDGNFTLTSEIRLDPASINSDNVKIYERPDGKSIKFKGVASFNNDLKFNIEPESELKYNTTYQVAYSRELKTPDGRNLFWKDYIYSNFTTEEFAYRPLDLPTILPPNKGVNIPIDVIIQIEFPIPMERTSTEKYINTSFEILHFNWSDGNLSLTLEHKPFLYYTGYSVSLEPGMLSANGFYQLKTKVSSTFTTVTGLVKYEFGPVLDNEGKPVAGVSLALMDGEEVIISIPTNESGHMVYTSNKHLQPGNYTIKMIKAGYKTAIWKFQIDQDGELIIEAPPPLVKKESESDMDMNFIMIIIILAILVIFLLIMLYMVLSKKDHKDEQEPEPQLTDKDMDSEVDENDEDEETEAEDELDESEKVIEGEPEGEKLMEGEEETEYETEKEAEQELEEEEPATEALEEEEPEHEELVEEEPIEEELSLPIDEDKDPELDSDMPEGAEVETEDDVEVNKI